MEAEFCGAERFVTFYTLELIAIIFNIFAYSATKWILLALTVSHHLLEARLTLPLVFI